MERYSRHLSLSEIGIAGQNKLLNAKVLVVGAGGLGCPILQYLAAAGVGTLGIVDFDTVEISNLQRQVLYGTSSIGQNKAAAAKARLKDLNDNITIIAYQERLTHTNAHTLFNTYDIIVDGTDTMETRYLINDTAISTNKPFVFGAIYKFEGQVSVFNYEDGPSYRCLFPNEQNKNDAGNCAEVGVLGILPGIIGCMQANEVLKMILQIGDVLSGKLLCYNALYFESIIIKIKKSSQKFNKALDIQDTLEKEKSKQTAEIAIPQVSIKEIIHNRDVQYIDVRELYEVPKINHLNVISIPLSELAQQLDLIDLTKEKVIFCQSGMRSKKAVLELAQLQITNCSAITETISEIQEFFIKQQISPTYAT